MSHGVVVIADDDASTREWLSTLLVGAGFETREAATGPDALAAARASPTALVLLDVNLPGLSGYEVCHELKAEFGDLLPVLFVSGERTEPYDRAAGILIGGDDYLVKPVAP